MDKFIESSPMEIRAYVKLKGEAAQKIYERQAEALKKGVRISVETAIEKLILGK